jgi:hypothetical protein
VLEIIVVLIAQGFVTSADAFVRTKKQQFSPNMVGHWAGRYALTRYTGLCLRLYALFILPVAAAATLFSTAAVGVSTLVAWRHGEKLTKREMYAIGLILSAIIVRSIP